LDGVTIRRGPQSETIAARTVVWAAGVQASPLGVALASATGVELDRQGRVVVGPDLSVPGHPEIPVLGDLAHSRQPDGRPLPSVAPVAMQQGSRGESQAVAKPQVAASEQDCLTADFQ
jgi:NADH dehydrogenase